MAKRRKKSSKYSSWLDSKVGKIVLNVCYSWGASVVILGALFKLTHIDGADLMLFIGMGTEVVVFFISGFERPWDPGDYPEDDEEDNDIPVVATGGDDDDDDNSDIEPATVNQPAAFAQQGAMPQTIIIGGGNGIVGNAGVSQPSESAMVSQPADGGQQESIDPAQLANAISSSAPSFNSAQFNSMTPEMQEATAAYVNQLNELTDILKQVAEQSARLTRDSEEMETMNRTLTGINRFYEMQLRSVGTQSATIDEVNEQTKRLAQQLQDLNEVYQKMVDALKMKIS